MRNILEIVARHASFYVTDSRRVKSVGHAANALAEAALDAGFGAVFTRCWRREPSSFRIDPGKRVGLSE
jgi:hypothetical protein